MKTAIMGYKGGVGKTTLTKLVADFLEKEEKEKTIILNLDFYQKKNLKIYSTAAENIAKEENIDLNKYNDFENIIIDAAGFADIRLLKLINSNKIDNIVLPSRIGELSLLELLQVLKDFKTKQNILIVINDIVNIKKEQKEKTILLIKQIISKLDIKHNIKLTFFKHYSTITNLEEYNKESKKGKSLIDKIKNYGWLRSYKIIKDNVGSIVSTLKKLK